MPHKTVIALVCSLGLDYCRGVLRGARRYAQERPEWELMPVAPQPRAIAALRRAPPAGAIAHVFSRRLAEPLARIGCPVINFSGLVAGLPFPRVGCDDRAVGRLAARHFLDRGFRRFAFVGHPLQAASRERETGFREELAAARAPAPSAHRVAPEEFSPDSATPDLGAGLRRWLAGLPRPVAILASSDIVGMRLAEACRGAGLAVPEGAAILGVDNDDLLCELSRPPLSSVATPAEAIGWQACAALEQALAGKTVERLRLLPPIGVVVRRSSDIVAVDDTEVASALRLIHQLAHRPLRVERVLRGITTSRRTFERRFRRCIGRSLAEEIRRAHLELARERLAGTDLSIAEVAEASGFTDQKRLSIAFRAAVGCTPSEYRRRHR